MIVQSLDQLPRFGDHDVVICDTETTSWDDAVSAFYPFRGCRVAGYALATEDGKQTWYLPVRHHGQEVGLFTEQNLPLKAVQQYMQDLYASPTRTFANHNAKFDARFMHFDGIKFNGGFEDTIVLARLVYGGRDKRFGGTGYSLEALAADYLNAPKDNRVAAYCKALKTKDWGRAPIRLMADHAETDVRLTARLRLHLLKHMPEPSWEIWKIEQRVSKLLLDSEIFGIPLKVNRLKTDYIPLLQRLVLLLNRVADIAGHEVNVSSSDDLDAFLQGQLGIEPTGWTDDGAPSWNTLALETLKVPPGLPDDLGQLLSEASRLSHFCSNFCEGWLKAVGEDSRLHPYFNQAGTNTGRLSSKEPNVQNFDDMAEAWLEEIEGRVLLYYDLSQAEYRVFGHYTGAQSIVGAYAANVRTDFHQWLADKIGVSRQFAKTMNFSFIYGMGKKKLLKSLSALLSVSLKHGDPRMLTKLRSMISSSRAAIKASEMLADKETAAASEMIYNEYHRTMPEIRGFQKRVANLCAGRGWIKNFYGRVYRLTAKRAYVGVNYVVQGTVGDYMKERSAEVFERTRDLDAHMVDEIHDAAIWSVPIAQALEFHRRAHPIYEESRFRIPMQADAKVTAASWSQMVKISKDITEEAFIAAMAESKTMPIMTWSERESRKYEGTSTKGKGVL